MVTTPSLSMNIQRTESGEKECTRSVSVITFVMIKSPGGLVTTTSMDPFNFPPFRAKCASSVAMDSQKLRGVDMFFVPSSSENFHVVLSAGSALTVSDLQFNLSDVGCCRIASVFKL